MSRARSQVSQSESTQRSDKGFGALHPAEARHAAALPRDAGRTISLNNWRRREWTPAVEASGVALPCRIYDLRSTFASNALAAGVTVFELARVMGTSVEMIEYHYGALIDGAHGIVGRLDAIEAALEEAVTNEEASN